MKLTLSFEQYDALCSSIATMRGSLIANQIFYKEQGFESSAELLQKYIDEANKALEMSSLTKVDWSSVK